MKYLPHAFLCLRVNFVHFFEANLLIECSEKTQN